jgi:hypothetical protein
MVNTARYRLRTVNQVALRGMNVWAIAATVDESLAAQVAVAESADTFDEDAYAKPLPTVPGL